MNSTGVGRRFESGGAGKPVAGQVQPSPARMKGSWSKGCACLESRSPQGHTGSNPVLPAMFCLFSSVGQSIVLIRRGSHVRFVQQVPVLPGWRNWPAQRFPKPKVGDSNSSPGATTTMGGWLNWQKRLPRKQEPARARRIETCTTRQQNSLLSSDSEEQSPTKR